MGEHAVHDKASGQLLTGIFMDYEMPRADDVPSAEEFDPLSLYMAGNSAHFSRLAVSVRSPGVLAPRAP